jgi:hypothetical protein
LSVRAATPGGRAENTQKRHAKEVFLFLLDSLVEKSPFRGRQFGVFLPKCAIIYLNLLIKTELRKDGEHAVDCV